MSIDSENINGRLSLALIIILWLEQCLCVFFSSEIVRLAQSIANTADKMGLKNIFRHVLTC